MNASGLTAKGRLSIAQDGGLPIFAWAHAMVVFEATREVRLADEAASIGERADRQVDAGGIRQALGRDRQPTFPDLVRDVSAAFMKQLLQPTQRNAHRGGEVWRVQGRVLQVGLHVGLRALDQDAAV